MSFRLANKLVRGFLARRGVRKLQQARRCLLSARQKDSTAVLVFENV